MGDPSVKRRLARAKKRVEKTLKKTGYGIIPSDNSVFCILGIREREIRLIRVVVDVITKEDREVVRDFNHPGICIKEIWLKKKNISEFEIQEISKGDGF